MRYSLVSRFRGTLIGALLAHQANQKTEISGAAITSCEKLIKSGKFNLEDWLVCEQNDAIKQPTQVLETAIFATLPLALFFHENPLSLRRYLLGVAQIWRDDLIVRDTILAISYAVARSLTEQLTPTTLIPELVSFIGETKTDIPQKLEKVNELLKQRTSLQEVKNEFGKDKTFSNPVAIGFYCFLAALEDFRLSILLAHQNADSPIVSTIVGALSGAYNSTAGIPITWQAQCMSDDFSRMVESVDGLFGEWSGLYEPKLQTNVGEDIRLDGKFALREVMYPLYVNTSPRLIKFR